MTTLVIDANNILVRSMKATEGRVSLSSHGVPTAALLVFINTLSRYIREIEPDRVAACWDGGRSTYRLSIDPDYKAARSERTEEPDTGAFALAKEFLSLANIHHVERPGVEADDLIAGYWRMRSEVDPFFILSGDKDFLQLLDGYTTQIRPQTGQDEVWTAQRVSSDLRCRAAHLPLVMALTGDAGDGVPGLPGFGHKTACKFLGKYDWDLEKLLTSGEAKVFGYAEQARRNLALVNLIGNPSGVQVEQPGPFTPTLPIIDAGRGRDLVEWLDRYEMVSVKERFLDGSLWDTPVAGGRMKRSSLH